ncbi:MAG: hypothetical protein LBB92_00510 [Endomicrobium sp.]|jgi:hypothetical protein|nr:hypothetical protein [Endomicrobium sp.]
MNNLLGKMRFWIRGILLKFARKLRVEYRKGPVIRYPKSLFSKEIKIPIMFR